MIPDFVYLFEEMRDKKVKMYDLKERKKNQR